MPRRRRWGTGSVVPPATPGGTWSIRYQDGAGGRPFESGFPSELLARQALEARRTDLARGRIDIPADLARLPTLATLGDAWMERRQLTHRGAPKEQSVWRTHLRPAIGALRAPELDLAAVRRYVEAKRAAGLAAASVRLQVRLLSSLIEDCRERPRDTGATGPNPCKGMPRSLSQQIRPTHDARLTPFIERADDIRRVYQLLPEPYRTGFAIGALAGLRTGEVRALRWDHIDLERRRLVVQQAVGVRGQAGPVKDSEARILAIRPELLPLLKARRLAAGGAGLVVPPGRPGRRSGPRRLPALFVRSQTLNAALHAALAAAGLGDRGLDWYRATRHTYASQYALAGGSLHKLAILLGHSSAEVTLRYAHLQPERLAEADDVAIPVDLLAPDAPLGRLPDPVSWQNSGRTRRQPSRQKTEKRSKSAQHGAVAERKTQRT